ncbi:hypothetical protein ACFQ6C_25925 [Streptomyces sp. NPDC056454]|uniref:hypothetical protein n=1 Tax=Streptomyces sp. NPDC056454 TaxID=3345823 RepID=UPI00367E275A
MPQSDLSAPQPALSAIRADLDLKKGQVAKLITYMAMDDITGRNRPRWQWTHPQLAEQLCVEPQYVALLQGYLEYRRTRVSAERAIRFFKGGAQIYLIETDMPLDLVTFPAGALVEDTARMARLFREAVNRKLLIGGDVTVEAERMFARTCLVSSWQSLSEVYHAQRTAQKRNLRIAA